MYVHLYLASSAVIITKVINLQLMDLLHYSYHSKTLTTYYYFYYCVFLIHTTKKQYVGNSVQLNAQYIFYLNNIKNLGTRKKFFASMYSVTSSEWPPAKRVYFGSFIINCVLALALNISIRKRLIFGSSKINEQQIRKSLSEFVTPSS